MLAYPGTFNYAALLRLKKRDFELWAWKAQKALVKKEMDLANTIRIAQATQSQYSVYWQGRKTELLRLDGKLKELHKEVWEELRMKKRG